MNLDRAIDWLVGGGVEGGKRLSECFSDRLSANDCRLMVQEELSVICE
jgi:hypothetical protein